MGHLFIRHKVEDFEQWRLVYDDDRSARETAGLEELFLWHNQDDPSEVVLLFEIADVAKARNFTESPDLQEKMEAGGVLTTPEVLFLAEG